MLYSTFLEKFISDFYLAEISPTQEPLWQPFSNKYLFPELAKLIILAKLINPATAEQGEELHHVATGLLHTNKYVTNQ